VTIMAGNPRCVPVKPANDTTSTASSRKSPGGCFQRHHDWWVPPSAGNRPGRISLTIVSPKARPGRACWPSTMAATKPPQCARKQPTTQKPGHRPRHRTSRQAPLRPLNQEHPAQKKCRRRGPRPAAATIHRREPQNHHQGFLEQTAPSMFAPTARFPIS